MSKDEDSENLKATDELKKDDLYQRMIEEIQDYAIILMDKHGYIMNWNKGAQKIKQYSEKEIIGKHFSIFYLQQDIDSSLPYKLMNEATETGRSAQEGWRKRKDGSKFWASVIITAIHDDANNVIGYCKVTRDLTDKKIAEDNLRISEERYQRMIAEVQDYAIILLSATGTIENWNIGAEKIKGYTAREVLGKNFELFYTEEDRINKLPSRLLNEAHETGKALQEGWRVRKDGTKFWGMVVITALHDKEGNVIGFSKVTRDLTQRKMAEEKLATYTAELETRNNELEQFAYVASHDLQEPLRKIQTFTELIQENYNDPDFVKAYFEKLDASAKRMSDLIKSLLDYSRLSMQHEVSEKVDLNKVLTEVQEDFELLIKEKNALITSEDLPAVKGNKTQLGQLFSNLVSNAIKFNRQKPVVMISSRMVDLKEIEEAPKNLTEENYLELSFKDNGIGFEKQYNKVIFSLFQRLHGKKEYPGTGIGLALCKKIVENHNGFITVISEPEKGTEFKIYFPASMVKAELVS